MTPADSPMTPSTATSAIVVSTTCSGWPRGSYVCRVMLRGCEMAPRGSFAATTLATGARACVTSGVGTAVGRGVWTGSTASRARLPDIPPEGLSLGTAVTEIVVSPARFAVTSTSGIPFMIDEYGAVMVALGPAGPPPIETVPNSTETVTRIIIPAPASL